MPADSDADAAILALSPIGCLLVQEGVILACNGQAVATMGIPQERLVGVPLVELLVPEYEAAGRDLLEESGDEPGSAAVRLAAGLAPVEFLARAMPGGRIVVGVRSMAIEHLYSAQAGGELTHDLATGLPDHFHVLSQLHDRLEAPKRLPMAIVGLWVDELPELVDVHGERAVERVVKEVASRIQGKIRAPDVLGRFERTGFLILMTTDAAAEELSEVVDRLRSEVAFPVELENKLVSFTTSVVVGSVVRNRPSIERVLALLEAAANRAVVSGGNRTDVLVI